MTASKLSQAHNRQDKAISKAIFIVGCPRSGTTLTQSVLACVPGATSFQETQIFSAGIYQCGQLRLPRRSISGNIKRFWQENALPNKHMPKPASIRPYFSQVKLVDTYRDTLIAATQEVKARILLEKTPRHLYYIPEITRSFKQQGIDVHFVHVLRDAHEVMPSLVKASQKWRRKVSYEEAATRWEKDIEISSTYRGHEGHLLSSMTV